MRVTKNGLIGAVAIALVAVGNIGVARANTILWISDSSGNIGEVDVAAKSVVAGSVHSTGLGSNLTDIAFVGNSLFGTTFYGLYSINPTTGAATSLGSYTVGGQNMNALVGYTSGLLGPSYPTSGLLSAAYGTKNIYNVNSSNVSGTTIFSTPILPMYSSGDLAFHGTTLYESAETADGQPNHLINVTTGKDLGTFHITTVTSVMIKGALKTTTTTEYFPKIYGLADDGTTMYAVNGTKVYSVDLANALLTYLFDYGTNVCPAGNLCLGAAYGLAFMEEQKATPVAATPLPGALPLFATGLGVLGFIGWRRKRRAVVKLGENTA